MAEPKIEKKSDRADPTLAAVATKRTSKTWDTNGVTPPADIPAPDALTREATHSKPPNYLDDALKHAELPDPAPDPFAEIRGNSDEIHKKFQLPKGLPNLAEAASERTTVYQDVRYFAQNVLDEVSFYYGATTA